MNRGRMPFHIEIFFEDVAEPTPPPFVDRLTAYLFLMPQKLGGARALRVECASLLTVVRRHALQAAAAGIKGHRACGGRTSQELAFRFLETAAGAFNPKSKGTL